MVLSVLLCASVCRAEEHKSIQIVEKSLAKGDVRKMSTVFDRTIDITFSDNKSVTYSKSQAGAILKKFFAKCTAKNFDLKLTGKSTTNNTLYGIGKLYTNTADYRVYLFFVPKKNNFLLKELRFEKL